MKLIMENWRKFLSEEKNSLAPISKIIKVENRIRPLVKKAIYDYENNTTSRLMVGDPLTSYRYGKITSEILKLSCFTWIFKDSSITRNYKTFKNELHDAQQKYKKLKLDCEKSGGDFENSIVDPHPDHPPGFKSTFCQDSEDFMKKSVVPLELKHIRAMTLNHYLQDIGDAITADYQKAIMETGIFQKSRGAYRLFLELVWVMCAEEKNLDPQQVFGITNSGTDRKLHNSLDSTQDPFSILQQQQVTAARKEAKSIKKQTFYPMIKVFLPDGWDKALENIMIICCNLLRQRFSSGEITFKGAAAPTPTYNFVSSLVGQEMQRHLQSSVKAVEDDLSGMLWYLQFKGGKELLKDTVNWVNSNQQYTLDECVGQVEKVLKHMARKGYKNSSLYQVILEIKNVALKILS